MLLTEESKVTLGLDGQDGVDFEDAEDDQAEGGDEDMDSGDGDMDMFLDARDDE